MKGSGSGRRSLVARLSLGACVVAGCQSILGIDEPQLLRDDHRETASSSSSASSGSHHTSGAGGSGGSAGASGVGGSAGGGGTPEAPRCDPSETPAVRGVFVSKFGGTPSGEGTETSP